MKEIEKLIEFRESIKVVDATLRDGGLVNDFYFSDEFVKALYKANVKAGVDYMEIGYKASKEMFDPDKFGKWKFCNEGFRAFLRDFDKYYAKLFDGLRHDSGNPYTWGEMFYSALKGMGIDPSTKVGCWSDSLDVDLSIAIAEHFNRRLKVAFGIGTFLCATIIKFKNGAVRKPLSMVMKVVMVKGGFNAKWVYVVKLSDSVGKTMCPDEKYIEHVKDVFEYVSIDDTMPEAS